MKNYINILITTILIGNIFYSCTKGFEEINTNPLLINKEIVKPEDIFAYVAKRFAFEIPNHTYRISSYSGYYVNPAGGNLFSNQDWSNPHNNFYRQYYINISEVERLTRDNPLRINQNAQARILKAMIFQHLTDLYGDLPYFQAAQGVNTTVLQPVYDKQEDIYNALLTEVKEAVEMLTTAPGQFSYSGSDLFYGGNVDKWRRLGNSLRLRMAMRIRYVSPSVASEHINDVVSKPLIVSNADNFLLKTLNSTVQENENPLYTKNLTLPGNMVVSFTTVDLLKRLSDPRLFKFAKPVENTANFYLGLPMQILEESSYYNTVSLMSDIFLDKVYSIVLFNAAETNFLRAEAANAGITSENPQSLYTEGIKLAMQQYSIEQGDINTYLASSIGNLLGSEEEKLEQIINQKWIANYYNHYEAYAEYRRTGYPRIWLGSSLGVTNGKIPRRLTYPDVEFQRNAVNVQEASSRMESGNSMNSRVWWDVKPGLPFAHPLQGIFPPEI